MKVIASLLLMTVLVSSCSFDLEKRRYMKGYHLSFSGKEKATPSVRKRDNDRPSLVLPDQPAATVMPAIGLKPVHDVPVASSENVTVQKRSITVRQTGEASDQTAFKDRVVPSREAKTDFLKKEKKSGSWFLLLASLFMLGGIASYAPVVPRSKKLGYWAIDNRKLVRGLHFVMSTLVLAGGLYTGMNLAKLGIHSSPESLGALAAFTTGVFVLHPLRRSKKGFFRNTFKRQKWFALLLALSGFTLAAQTGNILFSDSRQEIAAKYDNPALNAVSAFIDKNINVPNDGLTDDARIALTVLTVIVCVLLCILIGALACYLICSGQVPLALLTLFGGLTLVIVGTSFLVKELMAPIREREFEKKMKQRMEKAGQQPGN